MANDNSFEQFLAEVDVTQIATPRPEGEPGQTFDDFLRETATGGFQLPTEEELEPERGEFSKGLERGYLHTKALLHGGAAAVGDVLGTDEFVQNRINDYVSLMEEAEAIQASVARVEDIDSPAKFVSWAAGMIGEQIPVLATIVASGGAGGIISRLVANKLITHKVGQHLAANVLAQYTARGATAGTITGATAIETGGILGEQHEAGVPLRGGVALTGGLAAGSLEAFMPLALASYFKLAPTAAKGLTDKIATKLSGMNLGERMLTLGGAGALGEAGTESTQEAIAIAAREYVDENYAELGEEKASRILNAAAGGALLGFVFGGVGGVFRPEAPGVLGGEPTAEDTDTTAFEPPPFTPTGPVQPVGPQQPGPLPDVGPTIPEGPMQGQPGPHVEIITERPVAPVVRTRPDSGRALSTDAIIFRDDVEKAHTQPIMAVELKNDPVVAERLKARHDILVNPKSYMPKKGLLTKANTDLVESLENDIRILAEERGVQAPEFPPVPSAANLEENAVVLLTPGERRQLAKLEEKEALGELTDRQYERLEELKAKADGEVAAERFDPSQAALDEIDTEVRNQILAGESAAKKLKISKDLEQKLGGPLYGVQRVPEVGGISQEQFEKAIEKVRIADEGTIKFLEHPRQIQDAGLRAAIVEQDASGFLSQAIYVPGEGPSGTTYFFLDRIGSEERAVSMYLHEVLTHHGLRALPENVRNKIIAMIQRDRKTDMAKIAEQRGKEMTAEEMAEEVLAELAENNDFNMPLWKRVIAALRAWIRQFTRLKLSDNDMRHILYGMQRYLNRKGVGGPLPVVGMPLSLDPGPVFAVSPEDIPKFTLRIVDALPKRGLYSRGELESFARAKGKWNKQEQAVIDDILQSGDLSKKFSRADLEEAIASRVAPLSMRELDVDQTTLAGFGMMELGFDPASVRSDARAHILSFEDMTVPPASNHFKLDDYAAHARGITEYEFVDTFAPVDAHWYTVEVQTDIDKKVGGPAMTPEEIGEHQAVLDYYTPVNAELSAFSDRNDIYVQGEEFGSANDPEFGQLRNEVISAIKDLPAYVRGTLFNEMDSRGRLDFISPTLLEDVITESLIAVHERIHHAEVALSGNTFAPDVTAAWKQVGPAIKEQVVRQQVKWAAQNGKRTYNLADADTVALGEGWLTSSPEGTLAIDRDDLTKVFEVEEGTMTQPQYALASVLKGGESRQKFMRALQTKFPGGVRGFLKKYNPKVADLHREHERLTKWFTREYKAEKVAGPRNVGNYFQVELTSEHADGPVIYLAGGIKSKQAKRAKSLGASDEIVQQVEELSSLWKTRAMLKLLTLDQMAKKFKIPTLQKYIDRITQWAASKSEIITEAEETITGWRKLGKTEANALARSLIAITMQSDSLHRKLLPREKQQIFEQFGVGEEGQKVYAMVEANLGDVRQRLKDAMLYNTARGFFNTEQEAEAFLIEFHKTEQGEQRLQLFQGLEGTLQGYNRDGTEILASLEKAEAFGQQMHKIEFEMDQLTNRDYFPFKRFGKYTITLRATKDGQQFEGKYYDVGDVVAFHTFENQKEQENYFADPQLSRWRRTGEFEVSMGILEDKELSIMDLPPTFIQAVGGELGLSMEQQKKLQDIAYKYAPGSGFVKQMIKRKGISGMSMDAMRVFGTYMQSASNHIARAEFSIDLDYDIQEIKGLEAEFANYAGDTRGLNELVNYLHKHKKYIFDPGSEWAAARAIGFTWYLGFNVKSAMINFTQVPMVTYPYLANKYGHGKAFNMLLASIKDATLAYDPKTAHKKLPPYLDQLLARAIREGFIDEAMAVELAGVAQGPLLERVLPTSKLNRGISQFSYYAATPFRFTEKLTRRTAFIAAVKLARSQGADMEEAYIAGREAVRATLFEYAKWNRPEFMRGRKSVFFLFWTFMQHMAFTLFGGQGGRVALQVWVMLLMAAGLQGLPFAENLMNIFDWSATKVKTALGMKNPHQDTMLKLRELIATFSDNPDMWMHGLSREYGLGPVHLLSMLGVPVPHVDVSGSTGLGSMVPGLKEMTEPARSMDERLGRTLADIGGPVFGIGYSFMKALFDDNPDEWKRWERTLPSAFKAFNRAVRLASRGKEEFKGGGTVVSFDPGNTEHMMELIAQAFAFTPTRLNQRYELRAHQEEVKAFLLSYRQRLLSHMEYAKRVRDPEAIADIRKAIKKFNKSVPDARLRITGKTISESIRERRKRARAREEGIPTERSLRKTYRGIAEAFPEVKLER